MAGRKLLTNKQFKEMAKGGSLPESYLVIKNIDCQFIKSPDDGGSITVVMSTDKPDREGDTIAIDGWSLSNFKKNPVVLWAHEHKLPPIGKVLKTWIDGGKLYGKLQFTPGDMDHPLGMGFGSTISRMYKEGYLSAVSVGFRPDEWKFNESRGGGAIDFVSQELLEISAVPVPANPQALIDATKSGIDTKQLFDWLTNNESNPCAAGLKIARDDKIEINKKDAETLFQQIKNLFTFSGKNENINQESDEMEETLKGLIKEISELKTVVEELKNEKQDQEKIETIELSKDEIDDVVKDVTKNLFDAFENKLRSITGALD